jgi:tRNA1(Val) A37 N6-methylase TrmN6
MDAQLRCAMIYKTIVEAQIEAMGMQAQNMQMAYCEQQMAYFNDDFANTISQMNALIAGYLEPDQQT